jgi:hypothetical protein
MLRVKHFKLGPDNLFEWRFFFFALCLNFFLTFFVNFFLQKRVFSNNVCRDSERREIGQQSEIQKEGLIKEERGKTEREK